MSIRRVTRSALETRELGKEFGSTLHRGAVVGLVGTLGSGKTQFVKGVCEAYGIGDSVLSPTFVIMHRYEGVDKAGVPVVVQHFDFYRIRRSEELDEIGFRDLAGNDAISLIEWSDAFPDALPPGASTVLFEHIGEGDERAVTLPVAGEKRV